MLHTQMVRVDYLGMYCTGLTGLVEWGKCFSTGQDRTGVYSNVRSVIRRGFRDQVKNRKLKLHQTGFSECEVIAQYHICLILGRSEGKRHQLEARDDIHPFASPMKGEKKHV
jgi:hypothetical protein